MASSNPSPSQNPFPSSRRSPAHELIAESEESSSDDMSTTDSTSSSHTGDAQKKGLVKVVPLNPFENDAPWTCYEVFKLIFLGLTLFPIRLVAALLAAILVILFAVIASCGLALYDKQGCLCLKEPLSRTRQRLWYPAVWAIRLGLWSVGFWHIRVVDQRQPIRSADSDASSGDDDGDSGTELGGLRHPPTMIVAAPHSTWADYFLACWALHPPFPAGVGDSTILVAPGGARVAVATQSIFVNVKNKDSRESCRQVLAERADPSLRGPPIMIFPEGRLTNGKMLIQFKTGAFNPGQPVQPVLLRFPFEYFDPTCVGRNRGPLWFLRMMTQFANYCTVEILEAQVPNQQHVDSPKVFADQVRGVMADSADLPTTEHSYEDAFLFRAAARANIDTDFEVRNMRELLNVDMDELQRWLEVFKSVDTNHDGVLGREEFAAVISDCFSGSIGNSMDRLFDFFDTDGSGCVSYREFVQGLALFSGRCDAASIAKLAFLVSDLEGKKVVKQDVLRRSLDNAFGQPEAVIRTRKRAATEQVLKVVPTQCRSQCGYIVTWDERVAHCCFGCANNPGQHDAKCDRVVDPSTIPTNSIGRMMLDRSSPGKSGGDAAPSSPLQVVGVASPSGVVEEELDIGHFEELTRTESATLQEALRRAYSRLNWHGVMREETREKEACVKKRRKRR